ncbi:MAG: TIGR03936 family radical SAM-associated protein [Dehalococcoidia bacterium]
MKAQRLRVRYRVSAEATALSQRQIIRAWQEAAEASGLPLAYSQARRATPQISIAAPLPQGATSDCELADVFLSERIAPRDLPTLLSPHLPSGLEILTAWEVGLTAPSLQSQLRWAEYEVEVPAGDLGPDAARLAVDRLLAARTLPWEQRRETKVRRYDLRPLVLTLQLRGEECGRLRLHMRLRAEQEMTGRADQVVAALGLPPAARTHRLLLHVQETSPAVIAYRRLGQPNPH